MTLGREKEMQQTDRQRRYWRNNLKTTGALLALWFAVTLGVPLYARELNEIVIFGFPLGFYMGAQGALLIYLLIVWGYARYMNALDREYRRDADEKRSN